MVSGTPLQFSVGLGEMPFIGVPTEFTGRWEYARNGNPDIDDWFYLKCHYKFRLSTNIAAIMGNQLGFSLSLDSLVLCPADIGLIGCADISDRVSADAYLLVMGSDTWRPVIGVSMKLKPWDKPWAITPMAAYLIDDSEEDWERWSLGLGLVLL